MELVEGEVGQASRGEFEGEGDAVEAAAHGGGDGTGGPVAVGQRAPGGGGALGEQRHGVTGHRHVTRVGAFHRQRFEVQDLLAGQREAFAAGDQDAQAGRAGEQGGGDLGAVGEEVLAGVEDEQQPFAVGPFGDDVEDRAGRLVGEPEGLHDGEVDESRGVERGEFGQPDPVRVGGPGLRRRAQGEPGLAYPAGPDDAHQPGRPRARLSAHRGRICGCRVQRGPEPGKFGAPPDETVRLGRQIPEVPGVRVSRVRHEAQCVRTSPAPRPGHRTRSTAARKSHNTPEQAPFPITRGAIGTHRDRELINYPVPWVGRRKFRDRRGVNAMDGDADPGRRGRAAVRQGRIAGRRGQAAGPSPRP